MLMRAIINKKKPKFQILRILLILKNNQLFKICLIDFENKKIKKQDIIKFKEIKNRLIKQMNHKKKVIYMKMILIKKLMN